MPLPRKTLAEKAENDPDWKYSLSCKNSEQSVSTQSMGSAKDFLILNIKKCEKEFPNAMVIENESNGFTASVFAVTTSNSKTDSIPLKKGKNVIVIKYQLAKAKVGANLDIIERIILEH